MVAHDGGRGTGVDHRAHNLEGAHLLRSTVDEVADEEDLVPGLAIGALALEVAELQEQTLELVRTAVDVTDDVVSGHAAIFAL